MEEPTKSELSGPPPTTRILLIRHGETMWNAEGRLQGQLDIGLNDAGEMQARSLADILRRDGVADAVDAIVCSDLGRARRTAELLAAVCPNASDIVQDARLRELHFGSWQGCLQHEVQGVRATSQAAWYRGDLAHRVPGGESPKDLVTRGTAALREAGTLGSTVLVVAHGGLIRWTAVGLALEDTPDPSPDDMQSPSVRALLAKPILNCCCSTLVYDRRTDGLCGESWFEDVLASGALDDTG